MNPGHCDDAEVYLAPGKVLLFGEYAVLHGAPAVVVAVASSARCTRHGALAGVVVEGLGFGRIAVPPDGVAGADLPFARALLDRARRAHTAQPRPGRYVLDTSAFRSANPKLPGKLGLGSSAAATVVLARALDPTADAATRFAWAHAAHRAVQGGGSGADIAASAFGGGLRYRWFERAERAGPLAGGPGWVPVGAGGAEITALPLLGRSVCLAWSGTSASTPALMARVRAYAAADPSGHAAQMAALGAAAVAGESALVAQDGAALVAAAAEGRAALLALGEAAQAPLITPELEALHLLASRLGGVAKPTGAGGGDLVWLVGRDAEHEARLAAEAEAAGFGVLRTQVVPAA
jgi:phosphomevalonate kinase